MDIQDFFSVIPTAVWAALSGGISSIGTWFIGMRNISVSIERERVRSNAETSAGESAERAAFRATLMVEISALRLLIKECDAERDMLRVRNNAAEGQILVLKASNEIMEKWVAFFKDRGGLDARATSGSGRRDEIT